MPGAEFDEYLSWNEAGDHSLKSLVYLFRLEELTNRKISFDLFAREVTPRMFDVLFQPEAPDGGLEAGEARKTLFVSRHFRR